MNSSPVRLFSSPMSGNPADPNFQSSSWMMSATQPPGPEASTSSPHKNLVSPQQQQQQQQQQLQQHQLAHDLSRYSELSILANKNSMPNQVNTSPSGRSCLLNLNLFHFPNN
jgi:hypothetical protein